MNCPLCKGTFESLADPLNGSNILHYCRSCRIIMRQDMRDGTWHAIAKDVDIDG